MKNSIVITLKIMALASTALTIASAQADGFKCEGVNGTNIKVYNNTQPTAGTRNAAILVVSDANREAGDKTIVTISDTQGLVSEGGLNYSGKVDHRFKTVQKNKEIAGMDISELYGIKLFVDFSYLSDTPSNLGDKYVGLATFADSNGSRATEHMTCTRYLKN